MSYYTQDFGKRMKEISEGLVGPGDSEEMVAQKEELLEELTDICESIDFARGGPASASSMADQRLSIQGAGCQCSLTSCANEKGGADMACAANALPPSSDLGKVGGLPCVIGLLSSQHEGIQSRAAELLAVCAANNEPVQKVRRRVLWAAVAAASGESHMAQLVR